MIFNSIVMAQGIQDWESSGCVVDGVPTLKCLEVVFNNVLLMSSGFIMVVLFIMLVTGGFRYLTSFGNAEKIKKAQGTIRYALVGFAVFISAFLILKIIDYLFLGNQNKVFEFKIGE